MILVYFIFIYFSRGVATGGDGGQSWAMPPPPSPHFNFQTKKGPKVSVLNITDIAFYGCSEFIRSRNFTIFTVYAIIFVQFMAAFHFFLLYKRSDHFTFWKGPILNAWSSKNFLFVDHPNEDHNEWEFKPLIIARILDVPKKSSTTREASVISGPQLNIMTSILELLKIYIEIIIASKCVPLARIEKQAVIKIGPTEKFL